MFQGLAAQHFHHDELLSLVFCNLMNGADVGVIQSGRSARLAAKPLKRLGIMGQVFRKEFECYMASEVQVLGFVDDAHAATTKLFEDTVMADRFAQHSPAYGTGMVGWALRQVNAASWWAWRNPSIELSKAACEPCQREDHLRAVERFADWERGSSTILQAQR